MSDQQALFHDTAYDALSAVVVAIGGWKKVGSQLWPEKTIEDAGRLLRHCLHQDRAEKLDLEQLVWLLRRGCEAGCHYGMAYLADATGYRRPEPRTREEALTELQAQALELARTLDTVTRRMAQIDDLTRGIRRVG